MFCRTLHLGLVEIIKEHLYHFIQCTAAVIPHVYIYMILHFTVTKESYFLYLPDLLNKMIQIVLLIFSEIKITYFYTL